MPKVFRFCKYHQIRYTMCLNIDTTQLYAIMGLKNRQLLDVVSGVHMLFSYIGVCHFVCLPQRDNNIL